MGKRDEPYADRLFGFVLWNEYLTGQSAESLETLARKMGVEFPFSRTDTCYLVISGMERVAYREYGISAIRYDDGTYALWERTIAPGLEKLGYVSTYIMEIYHQYKHLLYLLTPTSGAAKVEEAAELIHDTLQRYFEADFLPEETLHGNFTVFSDCLHGQRDIMEAFEKLRQMHGYTFFTPERRLYALDTLEGIRVPLEERWIRQTVRELSEAIFKQEKDNAEQILRGVLYPALRDSQDRTLCLRAASHLKNSLVDVSEVIPVDTDIIRAFVPESYSLFDPMWDALCVLADTVMDALREHERSFGLLTRTAMRYIQKHFPESDLSLGAVAEYAGVSPAYLSRTFNREIGISIPSYILHMRMNYAVSAMREGDRPIHQIARESGFTDMSYFAKQFRKQFGESPSSYAEKIGKATPDEEEKVRTEV